MKSTIRSNRIVSAKLEGTAARAATGPENQGVGDEPPGFESSTFRQNVGVLGQLVALPGRNPGAPRSSEGSNPSTPTVAWGSRSLIARMSVMRSEAAPNAQP